MNLRRHRIHGREFISGQDFRSGAHLLNQLLESAGTTRIQGSGHHHGNHAKVACERTLRHVKGDESCIGQDASRSGVDNGRQLLA